MKIGPQAYPNRSCSRFQFFENHILRREFPMPPAPTVFDELVIDVDPIRQKYIGKRPSILVLPVGLKRDFFPED
jgi:hypothetical protein